jgi:hypothetical protein
MYYHYPGQIGIRTAGPIRSVRSRASTLYYVDWSPSLTITGVVVFLHGAEALLAGNFLLSTRLFPLARSYAWYRTG